MLNLNNDLITLELLLSPLKIQTRKVKHKSATQLTSDHALNHYMLLSCLLDISTLLFQRYLQLKIPKTELPIYLLSILFNHSTQFYWPSNCSNKKLGIILDLSFSLTAHLQMIPKFYQFSLQNISEIHLFHYRHVNIAMTANVYWYVLITFYILTHHNIVRRWVLSKIL